MDGGEGGRWTGEKGGCWTGEEGGRWTGVEGGAGEASSGAEDDGGDGYKDERCGLAVERGGLASLLMFVTFIIMEAKIGFTVTSPACVLQLGRVWMQELSTYLLSRTFVDFHKSFAAAKSNSCPGCVSMCFTSELFGLPSSTAFMCSARRTSKDLEVRP